MQSTIPTQGSACHRAVLSMQLQRLRGLPKEFADGQVKMRVTTGRFSLESHFSSYQEPEVFDKAGSFVDLHLQKVLEFLASDTNHSTEKIAEVAGMDLEVVEKVLSKRPSFTAVWEGVSTRLWKTQTELMFSWK